MPDLPSGTVTFLFTDIEGSTRLLDELGDGYAGALAEHRRALRAAVAGAGGTEVDTQGDAFLFAFARASDALAAAAHGQAALEPGGVRVRMGIHTGEPQLTGEGYVGMDLHVAARVAACAHGGQVVVSGRSQQLADGRAPLTDLGVHRLKDVGSPIHLFQLGNGSFPPLRSLNATNLPEPVSSFVGRQDELERAAELLSQSRLLTVTGPGGTGKTRFAIALARDALDGMPDGAWWVPLAALGDPRLVLASAERVLGAASGLAAHVGGKRMLLVLDNFEHVIDAAPELAGVLAACPNLTVLVTSRERLRIAGEREFALGSLSAGDAAQLFGERAQMPPDGPVQELCDRLERLPLAIELAAARADLLSPQQILDRLAQRLDLFRGGRDAEPRHSTLRATIDWSHSLLDEPERRAFARFSVFAGGATLDAVEAVTGAGPDEMQSLLDKSLVRRTDGRLGMLETIREYAGERLAESPELAELRERHARLYLQVARSANLSDSSPGEAQHQVALAEQENFRAALGWARDGGDVELGLRLATALENFWVSTDPFEAMRWFDGLLRQAEHVSPAVRAAALHAYGGMANPTGDDALAEQLYQQSLAEYQRLGDDDGASGAMVRLGHSAWYRGDIETGLQLAREGLAGSRRAGNERHQAQALGLLGELEFECGDHDLGLELLGQSADTAARCGFAWWQARILLRAAKRATEIGRTADAQRWALESLRLAGTIEDRRRTLQLLDLLSVLATEAGRPQLAGLLRGALLAELARGQLSAWSPTELPANAAGPAFEVALEQGRLMSLEAAVEVALTG